MRERIKYQMYYCQRHHHLRRRSRRSIILMQQTFKSLQGEFALFIMLKRARERKSGSEPKKKSTKEIFNKAHFLVAFIQSTPLSVSVCLYVWRGKSLDTK